MGSLCCVAARPHGPHAGSRQWSTGPNEPYWQTNTSFSPPISRRWDCIFPHEGLPYESLGGGQLDGSSQSFNSEESSSWVRDDSFPRDQYSASDGALSYLCSPSDSSPNQQSSVLPIRHIVNEHASTATRESIFGSLASMFSFEGTSAIRCDHESISSPSDNNDYEAILKGFSDAVITQNGGVCRSGGSSIDARDITGVFLNEGSNFQYDVHVALKCELCARFLSQRSPWSSWWIIKSGNMPAAAILSCHHVFHAECLEQTFSKTDLQDPPCPLCMRTEDESMSNQRSVSIFKNGFPWIKVLREEGPSKILEMRNGWGRL